jgi:hypothetical protein
LPVHHFPGSGLDRQLGKEEESMNFHRFAKTLGAVVLAILAVTSSPLSFPKAFAQVSVLTNKYDNARDGQNPSETLLSSATVNSTQFGKLFASNVDGYVSAQPLYMYGLAINGGTHNVAFVATEHDSVFAFDADTGVQLWQTSLLYPAGATTVSMAVQGCGGVTGLNEVGIVGTPVIDPTTNTLYVDAKTAVSGTYYHYLHALDVTTGLEKFGGPTEITGSASGLTFPAKNLLQRPALLLLNGAVYVAFGSNGCDTTGRGWLFAYSASTLQQLAVMTIQPDESYGSSIWQSGVGPAADSAGNVYVSTANGDFDYPNFPDYGDSILKLQLGTNEFVVNDYFTPFDQGTLAGDDMDLGSGGVTLLPQQTTGSYPNLMVTAGKRGDIYLLNMNDLGGYNTTSNDQIPQYLPSALGTYYHGSPLYFNNGSDQLVYFLSHQDYLKSFSLANGSLTEFAQTTTKLTTYGLPTISSNGTSNGILWQVQNSAGVPLLTAYDATALLQLYNSGQATGGRDTLGTVTHFATPTVANGKVYAGTQTQLVVYGLFNKIAATAGNGQIGAAGSTLPTALSINASNPYTGAPISGVTVTFSDGGKGGVFSNPTATTDVNGNASTTYTLPKTPQTITITGTSTGYAPVTFTESDVVGPVASISTISGSKQTGTVGTTLPLPIVVKAKDAVGNSVVGALIMFSDGGVGGVFSSPNPVATGSNGEASITYTLPLTARTITITASNGTVTDKITESAVSGPPALINIIQGNDQTAHINNKLPKALIVSVTDQYGNGLPGLTVNFTDNGAGGTFSNTAPVTGTTGRVSVTYTTSSVEGTVTIDASYGTLSPAVFTETVD